MSAELKAAAVYQSLACLAGKRKGDRDTIGDAFDAEVKIDIAAQVKMNGRRYTYSDQINGQLHVGERPNAQDEYSGPSAEWILAFIMREYSLPIEDIRADFETDGGTVTKEEIKAVKNLISSLAKKTGNTSQARGSMTFTRKD